MKFTLQGKHFPKALLAGLLAVVLLIVAMPATIFAVEEPAAPKAWFENVITGETENLRASSLLKVATSGFSSKAKLRYTFTTDIVNKAWAPLCFFGSADMSSKKFEKYGPDDSWSSDYTDAKNLSSPYFGVISKYNDSGSRVTQDMLTGKKVTVTVTDVNTSSSTYNKTATYTYTSFLEDDLATDISTGSYGIFVGETVKLLSLLARGGITHITCSNSSVQSATLLAEHEKYDLTSGAVTKRGSGDSTEFTGVKSGLSAADISVKKKSGCTFHTGTTGTGTIMIRVFPKPALKAAGATTLTLNNLDPDCQYFIELENGDRIEAVRSVDKSTVTFSDLDPETTYTIITQGNYYDKQGAQKHAYAYTEESTVKAYKATVNLKLDSVAKEAKDISGLNTEVYLSDANSVKTALTLSDTSYSAMVANGTYKIMAGTKEIGSITINGSNQSATVNFYTVTLAANGGTLPQGAAETTVLLKNEKFTLPAEKPTKALAYFNNWKVNATTTTVAPSTESTITATTTYTAQWLDDKNSNGVPDIYERTVTYVINNGAWSDKTTANKTELVVLKNGSGAWDVHGTAPFSAPTDMTADYGYEGGSWSTTPLPATVNADTTFTYSFTKIGDQTVNYNKPTDDGNLPVVPENFQLPYGKKVKVQPNGGSYKGSATDQIFTVESTLTVDDAARLGYLFMGWEKLAGDADADVVLKAVWEEDKNDDKIPDRYQKTVVYQVVNGKWHDGTTTDKTELITLTDDGKWSDSGTAVIHPVTADQPNYGYEKGSWDKNVNLPVTGPTTFVFTYDKIPDQEMHFNRPTDDGSLPPKPMDFTLPYGSLVKLDPNGGLYEGSADTKVFRIEEATFFADAVRDGYLFMGWAKLAGDAEYDAIMQAVWEEDKNDDGIPDKYQFTVTYKVVYGTWEDGTTADKTELLTLTTDKAWDLDGKATLSVPTGMIAAEGFEGGEWDAQIPATVSGTDNLVFTYTFTAKAPETGESSLWVLAIGALLFAGAILVFLRKRNEEAA